MAPKVPQHTDACDDVAEQATLASALLDSATFFEQTPPARLRLELFARPANRATAAAILRLREAGQAIDAVTVSGALMDDGVLGTTVPRSWPFQLAQGLGTAAASQVYVKRLEELYERRRAGRVSALEPKALRTYLPEALERLERGVPRIPTGWPILDNALRGGFVVPSLNVLGAKPKIGKSTWAQLVAERHVASGGFAYYLDLENGPDRFLRRLLCRRAEVGPDEVVRDGLFRDQERVRRWNRTVAEVRDGDLGRRLFLDTDRRFSPEHLEARVALCRELAGDAPLLVVIDSLQKLPMRDLSERRAAIDAWLRDLERLRDTYRVAVLLISELKRPAQGGTGYRANETSFKESGDIEYTGDTLLTLDRPAADEGAGAEASALDTGEVNREPATLRIVFNRDGRDGLVADYRSVFPHYGMEELPHGAGVRGSIQA